MPRAAGSEVGGVMAEAKPAVRSWSVSIPTWVLLGALFGPSFALRFYWAFRDPAPWIFSDELQYWEPARSLATTGGFAIRDVPGTGGFGFLYPTLIAPAFLLFERLPDAYDAVKAINSLLMSLTIFPTYLLARRFAGRGLSLAAAGLAVAIPALTLTGNVMTENAFYPLTAVWLLALVRALERPTLLRQAVVVALAGAGIVTKIQAVTFLPAMVTAIAIVVLLDALEPGRAGALGRIGRGAIRFWPTFALLALAVPAAVIRQALRDQPLRELLGAYNGVLDRDYPVSELAHWALYHVAALDIFVGFFPFAAFILMTLWGLRPSGPRELRIFAAVGLGTVVWFVVVVSAFASTPTVDRILERNLFHVVPLFFVALAAWIARGAPRPWWALAPAALFAGTLTLALPINSFLNATIVHSTPGLLPLWRWRDRAFSPESIDELVALAAIGAAALFVVMPRRFTPLLIGVLLFYFAAASRPVESFTHLASTDAFRTIGSPRDWIDRAVGPKANVASLYWDGDQVRFWENEFFNRSVGPVYSVPGAYDGLPGLEMVRLDQNGVMRDLDGKSIETEYLLTDVYSAFEGRRVAEDLTPGVALYEIHGTLVVRERVVGLFPDRWSGPAVDYERYDCRGGALVVRLTSQRPIHPRTIDLIVDQYGARRRVPVPPDAKDRPLRIDLVPRGRSCRVHFRMPTGKAAIVTPGDLRQLGLRFESIRYVPPR
jgi:hypothetical protein